SKTCESRARPARRCSTLGVRECIRLPGPAARMTIFTKSGVNSAGCAMLARLVRAGGVRGAKKGVISIAMRFVNGLMRCFILSSALAAVVFAATPACAQVYKWVDDRGVVNYSNEAPADRNPTVLDPKSARVSTYSTEDAPKRATGAPTAANESALSEK